MLGAVLRTLGRLPVATPAERTRTESLLVAATRRRSDPAVLEGAAHGLASLYRRTAQRQPASGEATHLLTSLLAPSQPPGVRRIAMAALVSSGRVNGEALLMTLGDPGARGAPARRARRLRPARARRARADHRQGAGPMPTAAVRYEALRAIGRHGPAATKCGRLLAAVDDRDPNVKLLAIDLLGGLRRRHGTEAHCARARPGLTGRRWHLPAHALVALARADFRRGRAAPCRPSPLRPSPGSGCTERAPPKLPGSPGPLPAGPRYRRRSCAKPRSAACTGGSGTPPTRSTWPRSIPATTWSCSPRPRRSTAPPRRVWLTHWAPRSLG